MTWTKFKRTRGDTIALPLTLRSPDSLAAFNPAGHVLIFTLKRSPDDTDANALVQKISTAGGFTTIDSPAGKIEVELVPSDTANLDVETSFVFDVQAQSIATGKLKTIAVGYLTLEQEVTRGTTISIATTVHNPPLQLGPFYTLALTGTDAAGADNAKLCGLGAAGVFTVGSILRAKFPGNIIVEFELEQTTDSYAGFLFAPYNYDAVLRPFKWRINRVHRGAIPCTWNADTQKWHDLYAVGGANFISLAPDQTGFNLPP